MRNLSNVTRNEQNLKCCRSSLGRTVRMALVIHSWCVVAFEYRAGMEGSRRKVRASSACATSWSNGPRVDRGGSARRKGHDQLGGRRTLNTGICIQPVLSLVYSEPSEYQGIDRECGFRIPCLRNINF